MFSKSIRHVMEIISTELSVYVSKTQLETYLETYKINLGRAQTFCFIRGKHTNSSASEHQLKYFI